MPNFVETLQESIDSRKHEIGADIPPLPVVRRHFLGVVRRHLVGVGRAFVVGGSALTVGVGGGFFIAFFAFFA